MTLGFTKFLSIEEDGLKTDDKPCVKLFQGTSDCGALSAMLISLSIDNLFMLCKYIMCFIVNTRDYFSSKFDLCLAQIGTFLGSFFR